MGSISCPFHWNISINLFTLVLVLTTKCKWIILWIIYACVLLILWTTFGHLKRKISIHNSVRCVSRCSASLISWSITPSILLHFTTALKWMCFLRDLFFSCYYWQCFTYRPHFLTSHFFFFIVCSATPEIQDPYSFDAHRNIIIAC